MKPNFNTLFVSAILLISITISSCTVNKTDSPKAETSVVENEVTISGYMTDARCGESLDDEELAKIHSRECCLEIESEKSGYGVFSQGKFQKFDSASVAKAKEFLRSIQKEEELKVQVKGQWVKNALRVESISLL